MQLNIFQMKPVTSAIEYFSDEAGNFYLAPAAQSDHYMRPKDISDGALPAPGSIMIQTLLKLSHITGEKYLNQQAEKSLTAMSGNLSGAHYGMTSLWHDLGGHSPELPIIR